MVTASLPVLLMHHQSRSIPEPLSERRMLSSVYRNSTQPRQAVTSVTRVCLDPYYHSVLSETSTIHRVHYIPKLTHDGTI